MAFFYWGKRVNHIGKTFVGDIVRWQDDKGFGFIASAELAQEVFFHISEYRARHKRPHVGDKVVFVLARNPQGKLQAQQVQEWQFVQQQQQQRQRRQQQQAAFSAKQQFNLLAVVLIYGGLVGWAWQGKLPWAIVVWYVVWGIITFLWYGKDKRAAQSGNRRTPENTLHMLSVLGGWLGAWLAQTYLRHKSQKISFRVVYVITMVLNIALLWFLKSQAFFGLI